MRIGIISDTHGYLDPRVCEAFTDVGAIVHAGDIGAQHVLMELDAIAPVYAVLGNCDYAQYGPTVNARALPRLGGKRFLIVHRPTDVGSVPDDVAVVVNAHTHWALVRHVEGVLYVNPGSASEPRDGAPSVAIVDWGEDGVPDARIVYLS